VHGPILPEIRTNARVELDVNILPSDRNITLERFVRLFASASVYSFIRRRSALDKELT
jgi:hypothetical protein